MSALVVASQNEMQTMLAFAEKLAASNLLPRAFVRQPSNVLYAIEYGRTINVPPMTAMLGIHVIEGKPTASSALISGLVRRAGHKLRIVGDDRTATATIIRSDDPDFEYTATWTLDRAKAAELTRKEVWKKYPAAMLKARAITEVARDACQEALFGLLYTPEELGVRVDGDGAPITAPTGEYLVGEIVEITEDQVVTWSDQLTNVAVAGLRAVAIEINTADAWNHTSAQPGEPPLRQVLLRRLGDEVCLARTREELRELWGLISGAQATEEEYTFTRDGETVSVLLGEFCRNRGEALKAAETAVAVVPQPRVSPEGDDGLFGQAQTLIAETLGAEPIEGEVMP